MMKAVQYRNINREEIENFVGKRLMQIFQQIIT